MAASAMHYVYVTLVGQVGEVAFFISLYIASDDISEALARAEGIARAQNDYDLLYPYSALRVDMSEGFDDLDSVGDCGDYYDPIRRSWIITPDEPMPFLYPSGLVFDETDPEDRHDNLVSCFSVSAFDDHQEVVCIADGNNLGPILTDLVEALHGAESDLMIVILDDKAHYENGTPYILTNLQLSEEILQLLLEPARAIKSGHIYVKMQFRECDAVLHLTHHKIILLTTTQLPVVTTAEKIFSAFGLPKCIATEQERPDHNLGHYHYEPSDAPTREQLARMLLQRGFAQRGVD